MAAKTCDLLIRNAHIVTCDTKRTTYPSGAIAVRGRDIVAVGRSAEIEKTWKAGRGIDAGGSLVHPGLIDMHYHTTYHMVGKMIAEVDFGGEDPGPWVAKQYLGMIDALDDELEYANVSLLGLDMLKSGVTTVMDPGSAFEPEMVRLASDALGFRASVADPFLMDERGPQLSRFKRAKFGRAHALKNLGRQLFRNKDPLAKVRGHVSVYGMGNDSDELRLAAKKVADKGRVAFNMHQSQSVDDAEFDDRRFGRHPLVHFEDIGLLGKNCVFVHMNVLRPDEYGPVERSGLSIVWSPTNSWYYGARVQVKTPMPRLHRSGVNIAIGLDVSKAASFGDQMYTAYALARDQGEYVSPDDLLRMYSINGATALGWSKWLGSIEAGKRADIVIRNSDVPEVWPRHNQVRQHVLLAKSRTVDTVIVDGEVLVKAGKLTRMDEAEIYARADAAGKKMRKAAGISG
ncbi:MAG: amidohydrolase family protein [Alphaproteobacteria bacterium]